MERLQKYLAQAGIASRRKCEEIILAGRVEVNHIKISELGFKIDPLKDKVKVDGKLIKGKEDRVYYLLNKPKGVVSTVKDPQGRKKVTDLIGTKERIYPVGRLDSDTEGLILLTNDGVLTNALTHPSFEINKTYLALVKGRPSEKDINLLRKGIPLEDGMTAPAVVEPVKNIKQNALIKITIHEGRNRQVRRMFEYVGSKVIELKRIKFCFLTLQGLKVGEYRKLSKEEVLRLKKIVKIS